MITRNILFLISSVYPYHMFGYIIPSVYELAMSSHVSSFVMASFQICAIEMSANETTTPFVGSIPKVLPNDPGIAAQGPSA